MADLTFLRPFWRYYGGKWLASPKYPTPGFGTIVEPFAGAAGYSLRHYWRDVLLIEKYDVIAELWRWLIGESAAVIRLIPIVGSVDDLPAWVPEGGRSLVGFNLNPGSAAPKRTATERSKAYGWNAQMRHRAAAQVEHIRHWRVIEGSYELAPDALATWFIDPPYQRQGKYYRHSTRDIDFAALARFCRARRGQVIVCENKGADWLPFSRFADPLRLGKSEEVVWGNFTA